MVLAGLGLNPAGVLPFRNALYRAPWGCFGTSFREFLADEVATSTEPTPGSGIIASSFFRASERNVRQFYGGWFWQVWGLNPAGVLPFRNHAPESSLRTKWPLPGSPLQAVASLYHLSLGRQNATLGSFTGDGSGRFGLESCWGSAVSEPCSREFLADEVATSRESTAGSGIIVSSFFRASERNVRQFYGGWFWQVWGLNPAGVLPFRNHAPESSLRTKWPLPGSPLQAVASLYHLSLGRQNATLGSFTGDGSGRFGLESCWFSSMELLSKPVACPARVSLFGCIVDSRVTGSAARAVALQCYLLVPHCPRTTQIH